MKKRVKAVILVGVLVIGLAVTYTVFAAPGDDSDPVISLSYLTDVFKPQVKAEISQTTQFQVISVAKGQTLVGEAGTEMILRMGTASVVSGATGGLSDVTAGYDLTEGSAPANHLLIVPKADGRGLKAAADCLIMVKGGYTLQ